MNKLPEIYLLSVPICLLSNLTFGYMTQTMIYSKENISIHDFIETFIWFSKHKHYFAFRGNIFELYFPICSSLFLCSASFVGEYPFSLQSFSRMLKAFKTSNVMPLKRFFLLECRSPWLNEFVRFSKMFYLLIELLCSTFLNNLWTLYGHRYYVSGLLYISDSDTRTDHV